MPLSQADQNLLNTLRSRLALSFSTGTPMVDELLKGAVGVFEKIFPGRIPAYYIAGSYANGTAVSCSDVDLHPLFEGGVDTEERAAARELGWLCDMMSPLDFNILPKSAVQPDGYNGIFKLNTRLVYGRELSGQWAVPAIDTYIRRAMRNDPQRVIRGAEVLSLPLSYPDPTHEFLGYVNEPVASTDGYVGPGTRDLVSYLYGMLIPLLSCQTKGYVVSKEEAFRRFPQLRPGVLGDFIAEVWERCRHKWAYKMPTDEADRQYLRTLCAKVLDFETMFLEESTAYWLAELERWEKTSEGNIGLVLGYLGTVALPDGAAASALARFRSRDQALVQLANQSLQQLGARG